MTTNLSDEFIAQSVRHLESDFLPRILDCLDRLSEEQIWWRPNSSSNSVGNLILHLAGNVRQWIVSGVGGASDVRKRDAEFAEKGPLPTGELAEILSRAVREASAVIRSLDESRLLERRKIQIYDVSVMQAVLHVVEHFSHHTGQILYVTKLLKDQDLGFYADLDAKKGRF